MPRRDAQEDWDKEIPTPFQLKTGHYELQIIDLQYINTPFADQKTGQIRKALEITAPEGRIRTGAWNVINFLRENKPVIGKTLSFDVKGEKQNRRFENLELL